MQQGMPFKLRKMSTTQYCAGIGFTGQCFCKLGAEIGHRTNSIDAGILFVTTKAPGKDRTCKRFFIYYLGHRTGGPQNTI